MTEPDSDSDHDLIERLKNAHERIAEHLHTANALAPAVHPNYAWLSEWLDCAEHTTAELAQRFESKGN